MRPAYKTIVCATDLSTVGNAALPVAYALAGRGSTVHVLTVAGTADGDEMHLRSLPPADPHLGDGGRGRVARARAHLEALCATCPTQEGVRTEIHVEEGWDAAGVIESLSRDVGADIVVLGTHGRTGFGRLLMGSVATEVLRRRRVPMLLLHDMRGREAQARRNSQPAP